MAQRVRVELVDDIDGGDASETVTFGLDGATYEIDLSAANADKLREVLAPYIAHGRRAGGRKRATSASSAPTGRGGRKAGSSSGASAAEVRAWARENGHDVPDRGRVSSEVREAYDAAH